MVLPQDMTFSPPRSHFSPPGVGPSHRQKDNLSPKGMIWYPQLPPSLQKLRRFLPQSTHVSSRQRSEGGENVISWGRTIDSCHRRIEWPGLKRSTVIAAFRAPCYVQGRQPLDDQAAQRHIQPGLESLQGWGLRNLPGQAVPVHHHPRRAKLLPTI